MDRNTQLPDIPDEPAKAEVIVMWRPAGVDLGRQAQEH
jgi:hypothetical protein